MSHSANPQSDAHIDSLIIVYNADEGWASSLMDAVHKIVRPETYACSLCMISYGAVSMRKPWRKYLDGLPHDVQFYHRQDFSRAYPPERFPIVKTLDLPAIMVDVAGDLQILLSSDQLALLADVEDLITQTNQGLLAIQN
ncbi:MAG: hypothetical protein ABJF89_10355 [Parasphingorhabdus sp.]|uniref:hypothetical protein n=1 Tax=Parasphingorhabdus sp. TaxID=2709688 RepID=UPI003267C4C5